MPAIRYIHRLQQMDQLIRLKATGTPEKFAAKLKISKRALYEYLNDLKEMGAPLKYSEFRQSYIYLIDVRLEIGFINQ